MTNTYALSMLMTKRRLVWALLLGWLLALVAAALPGHAHIAAAAEGGTTYRVLVSKDGFQLEGGGELAARAGEEVSITFVYADTALDYDNPHRIYFPGLELKSEMLNQANPETTVTFVPTASGRIPFKCVEECNGHKKLQDGFMSIAAGPAPAQPTQMRLTSEAAGGKALNLTATLTTVGGKPVAASQVVFYQAGAFLGAEDIRLGQAITDPEGRATLRYEPRREGSADLRAAFVGNVAYKASQVSTAVEVPGAAVGHYELEPRDLVVPGLGNWILWVVLAAVWGTFGYVVYSVARIPKVAMAGGPGMATAPAQMAISAAQQAGHLAGTPGGGSTWSAQHTDNLKEVKKMEGAFWKLAIGVLALLQVATWSVGSYRSNIEHENRVGAESEIRGNLAEVAQGLQALQADMKPMLAQQKALTDMLAQQATTNQVAVDRLSSLQGRLGEMKQQVEDLQTQVKALPTTGSQNSSAAAVTAAAPAQPAVVEIPVGAYHFGWDPGTIEVNLGDTVRILVTNDMNRLSPGVTAHPEGDEAIHGFGIEAYGIDVEVPPGQTVPVEFKADQAGEFPIECTVWCGLVKRSDGTNISHQDMKGKLIVR